jgi:methyl-accepting chemotaxis protein
MEQTGKQSRQQAQAGAIATIRALRYDGDGYFWINDLDGRVILHPIKPDLDGTDGRKILDSTGQSPFAAAADIGRGPGRGFFNYMWPKPDMPRPVEKISYASLFAPWGWVIASGIYVDDLNAIFRTRLVHTALWLIPVISLLVVLSSLIGRSITKPVTRLTASIAGLATGDLDVIVPGLLRRDEIGVMARAVGVFKQNAIAARAAAASQAADRAAKERRQAALDRHTQEFGTSIVGVMGGLTASAEGMRDAAGTMADAAGGVRTEATDTAVSVAP